jgi:hypothetical protein
MTLFDRTGDVFWKQLAGHIVSNILFLQAPEGGFIHASNEFEPTYTCRETCPIAQGRPANALLAYAAWPNADPLLREEIEPAVRRFWAYMADWWWRRGNGWKRPLVQAGWCGVTNQDFVIVEAMARFGAVYGDWSQYEQYGKPALDDYLEPNMYHHWLGLFERGDQENFAERTSYYNVILPCLRIVQDLTNDDRLTEVIDNIGNHLFDAIYTDDADDAHIAWGALTDADDKSRVIGWKLKPIVLPAYPELIQNMRLYLEKFPDAARARRVDAVESTLCAWVFADGTLPSALGGADPLFEIAPTNCFEFWSFLIDRLGADVRSPASGRVIPIRRTRGGLSYHSNALLWSIVRDGARLFAGLRTEPSGVVCGDEELRGVNFAALDVFDIDERVGPTAAGT